MPAVLLSRADPCDADADHAGSAVVISIPDISTRLRRAEWECFAVELRAKCRSLIEAMIDDEDEVETRVALMELSLLNPADHEFEIDTELLYDRSDSAATEGSRTDSSVRSLDDDLDAARG